MIKFTKMSGLGNDFIFVKDLENYIKNTSQLAKDICHRNCGIGADGLILVRNSKNNLLKMDYLNSDGSFAAMCGNGLRCFGKYVYDQELVSSATFSVVTDDGIKKIDVIGEKGQKSSQVKIEMGLPAYGKSYPPWEEIWNFPILDGRFHLYLAKVGVPHGIIFCKYEPEMIEKYGKIIEHLELFPEGINVNFVEIVSNKKIKVYTWERGAGHTLACGTGCCASAFVAYKLSKVEKNIDVQSEGGNLQISIIEESIYMQASADNIASGVYFD